MGAVRALADRYLDTEPAARPLPRHDARRARLRRPPHRLLRRGCRRARRPRRRGAGRAGPHRRRRRRRPAVRRAPPGAAARRARGLRRRRAPPAAADLRFARGRHPRGVRRGAEGHGRRLGERRAHAWRPCPTPTPRSPRRCAPGCAQGLLAAPRQALACADQTATWAGLDGADTPWFAGLAADGPPAAPGGARSGRGRRHRGARGDDAASSGRSTPRRRRARRTPSAPTATSWRPASTSVPGSTSTTPTRTAGPSWSASRTTCARWRPASSPGRRCSRCSPTSAPRARPSRGSRRLLAWLQALMDETMDALDGTHFDLTGDIRKVEAALAPPGSAAAAYYTPPSHDFSRPGQTWYPTLGRTRFPIWEDVSTWYHEGVPGPPPPARRGGWPPATSCRATSAPSSCRATRRAGRSTPSG